VHDNVEVIKKHPTTFAISLTANWINVNLIKGGFDSVNYRTHLAFVISRSNQENVGDDQVFTDIKQNYVLGFLVISRLRRNLGNL
jgi:hypothetical protein